MTSSRSPWRKATSCLFFANGVVMGSWAPEIPELAARLNLSQATLGSLLVLFGVGSLVTMPLISVAVASYGSRAVVRPASIVVALALIPIVAVPNALTAAFAIFLLGSSVGAMDIAMNANAVAVEREVHRPIMSSFHGFWSVGGLVGALIGGPMIDGLGSLAHALIISGTTLLIVLAVGGKLLDDQSARAETKPKLRLTSGKTAYLLGAISLFATIPEGATLDWGALYMRKDLGGSLAMSGFAFGVFSAAMAVFRFAGDAVRSRLRSVPTLRLFAVFMLVGTLLIGISPHPAGVLVGFAIAGVGISNITPIAYSAAGNIPGVPAGIAIGVVNVMAYSGFLTAPTAIGFISEHTGLGAVFAVFPLFALGVLALSSHARHADRSRS